MMRSVLLAALVQQIVVALAVTVPMQIIHINDNHGRFEVNDQYYSPCGSDISTCFGGFAKQQSMADIIKAGAVAAGHDVLFLHAGDEFTGTVWDYVYVREGNMKPVANFVNQLGLDAFTMGNHEFDYGPELTSYFLSNLTVPVVSCNTDVSNQPALQGLFKPFVIKTLPISGVKVGIVGFITAETNISSSPGPTVKFAEPTAVVGQCVAAAKAAGAEIVIALTHIGFNHDVALAQHPDAQGLDLIVGGHSHTLLYTGTPPNILKDGTPESFVPPGPYPTMVTNNGTGKQIPVVQALWASRYMGSLRVDFTPGAGAMIYPSNPILLGDTSSTNYVFSNAWVAGQVESVKGPVNAATNDVVGQADVLLDGARVDIRNQETNLGDIITDSLVWYATVKEHFLSKYPNTPVIGHYNGGGIRSSIPVGPITYGEVITTLPFGDTLYITMINSSILLSALNSGVSQWTGDTESAGRFPQVSGLRFSFNSSAPAANRVIRVQLVHGNQTIELSTYTGQIIAVMIEYVATGGDGYDMFANTPVIQNSAVPTDEILAQYLPTISPVNTGLQGRIVNCAAGFDPTNALCSPA